MDVRGIRAVEEHKVAARVLGQAAIQLHSESVRFAGINDVVVYTNVLAGYQFMRQNPDVI